MSFNRRHFLQGMGIATGLAAVTNGFSIVPARAQPSVSGIATQVPGIYRTQVGAIQVTAILDGGMSFSPSLFPSTLPQEAAQAQKDAFQEEGDIKAYLNSFVIRTGSRLILVDSGYGGEGGPKTGKLLQNLAAAGFKPSDFTDIYLTHAHPDHVNGLIDAAGKMVFPDAQLRLSDVELQHWQDDEALARAPEGKKGLFAAARKALNPYQKAGHLLTFKAGGDLSAGIHAVDLAGHTPGHSGFRLTDGKEQLLIWGDIIHAPALQFGHPEWSIAFDTDSEQAARTRQKILDEVATDRVRIAGMHLVFPALGHVKKDGRGYAFTPQVWEV